MIDYVGTNWLQNLAKWSLGNAPSTPGVSLRLFVNNVTISCSTAFAALTQCTAPGYAAITIPYATWGLAVVGCDPVYTLPVQYWVFSGPGTPGQTIYGHYVVDTAHNQIMWAANWDTPLILPAGAITVAYTAQVTYAQCTTFGAMARGAGVGIRSEVLQPSSRVREGQRRRRARGG